MRRKRLSTLSDLLIMTERQQDGPSEAFLTAEDVPQVQTAIQTEEVQPAAPPDPPDWARHQDQNYFRKRSANNAFWTDQAIRHGSRLEATASTSWVRSASLRRLKSLIKPSDNALEVGCGNGSSLLGPLSSFCRAFGVDLTWEMLLIAKQEHDKIKGLVRSDACQLPFPDGKFDVVYTSRCIINVPDPAKQSMAIREAFRVTKPEGTVIFIENFEEPVGAMNRAIENWGGGEPVKDDYNLLLSLKQTLELGQEIGWRPVRVRNNTLASFVTHSLVRRIAPPRAAGLIDRLLYPFYCVLGRIEDGVGSRLPLFGKDTMVVFKKA